MGTQADRRAAHATRIPFEAVVEVGAFSGPAFEAQAVDVSEGGMHLRTAYLPEVGQLLTCRFEAGPEVSIVASGEVAWRREGEGGGEFGVRFSSLDPESEKALRALSGVTPDPEIPIVTTGTRVRLHIEGLGAPMRARIRDVDSGEVTVGSDLGFLQIGKPLELEDATTGEKRPAHIDQVDVELDKKTSIPQLVVKLRYDDEPQTAALEAAPSNTAAEGERATRASRPESADDLKSLGRASTQVKDALSRSAATVAPKFDRAKERVSSWLSKMASRRGDSTPNASSRRTTAPAPGGGVHAEGRSVVRGARPSDPGDATRGAALKQWLDKRKLAVGAAATIAAVLAGVALRKPAAPPPLASDTSAEAPAATTTPSEATAALVNDTLPPAPVPQPAVETMPLVNDVEEPAPKPVVRKRAPVTPFGNGPVAHANVLRLRMDGPIERIQGAAQPNGFTVVVPTRKSLEAAGPLAARDARIAAIRVVNDPNGAELVVAFKDGVPNYQVRAKGEFLEIALAPMGTLKGAGAVAERGDKADKRGPARTAHATAKHDPKKKTEREKKR